MNATRSTPRNESFIWAARAAKVTGLLRALDQYAARHNRLTADQLETLSDRSWRLLAMCARVTEPSATTRAAVIAAVRAQEAS